MNIEELSTICRSCNNKFTYKFNNYLQTICPKCKDNKINNMQNTKNCKICNSEFSDPYINSDICSVCILKPTFSFEKYKEGSIPVYTSKGTKNDQAKPDLSLIPKDPLWELAKVLMAGEKKYGRWNWQNGIEVSRLTAAAMRHITQFNDGELIDEETQTSHLINACANLFFAFWMLKNKPEYDNVTKKKP